MLQYQNGVLDLPVNNYFLIFWRKNRKGERLIHRYIQKDAAVANAFLEFSFDFQVNPSTDFIGKFYIWPYVPEQSVELLFYTVEF